MQNRWTRRRRRFTPMSRSRAEIMYRGGGGEVSRPEFPNCILPPACIARIREAQEAYDRDPERWEREEGRRAEEREAERLEEEMEREGVTPPEEA